MWLNGLASIDIRTLDSAKVRTPGKHIAPIDTSAANLSNAKIEFGSVELADALTRSSLSRDPTAVQSFLQGISNWIQLQYVVAIDAKGRLWIDESYREILRDSPLTSFSGQIGQAITYLVARFHFNQRQVVDFGRACRIVQVTAPRGNETRPDFAGTANDFKSVQLFESKGSLPARNAPVDWKGDLRGALIQIDAGISQLSGVTVERGWAVAVALRCQLDNNSSEIAVADPDGLEGVDLPPERKNALMGLHYAAWLTSVGAQRAGELLSGDSPAEDYTLDGYLVELSGREWFVPDPHDKWSWYLEPPMRDLLGPRAIELNLAQRLLKGGDVDNSYEWPAEQRETAEGLSAGPVVFNDGTAVIPWSVREGKRHSIRVVRRPTGSPTR
jgi:hypothetical protein